MATAKKAPAHKQSARATASAKQAPVKAAAKKAASPSGRAVSKPTPAPSKKAPSKPSKQAPAKKAPAARAPVAKAPAKAPVAKAPAKPAAKAATVKPAAKPAPAKSLAKDLTKSAAATKVAPTKIVAKKPPVAPTPGPTLPAPVKGEKDGVKFTKDFDAKFLLAQRALLFSEREALTGQATRLEDEANSLIEEQEMGDVQFDDEGGEGDTMVVERERDLALSAQARQTIADIDAALERLAQGTYGYSLESGRPIGRERLEAIPWATVLVEEKVGGIGRR
jgi:RNA polymerase-binding transcription factor DksA